MSATHRSSEAYFEPLILGHNSFFGVDHLSAREGISKFAQFGKTEVITERIELAMQAGAQGMMMSTHERALLLCEVIRKNPRLHDQLSVYPLLPYAQKYVTAANEKGMLNVLFDMIKGDSALGSLRLMWQGTKGVINKDIYAMIKSLIQIELKAFSPLKMRAVFLHDVFTDLILAFDMKDMAYFFIEEMEKQYKSRGAFATKNLPMLLEKFTSWGIEEPLVMAHVNKIGYWMHPSQEKCEQALKEHPCHVMAMSTLASGVLKPDQAYSYIKNLGTVESVVIGASKPENITASFEAAKRYLK